MTELEWARTAHQHFTTPECLHVAFGATGRLEQFIRFSMYRNLLPFPSVGLPDWLHYLDLETLTLAIQLLRPDEFPWRKSKLSSPAALHQFLTWDAKLLGQNRAIRAKEILEALVGSSPRLVEHAIRMSSLPALKVALGLDGGEVSDLEAVHPNLLVHSSIAGRHNGLLAFPVAVDVTYPDMLFVADLEADLSELCDPTTERLSNLVRTRPGDSAKPLVRVSLSRLPFCAPMRTIRPADAARLRIDQALVTSNVAKLRECGFLAARLKEEPILELAPQPFDVYHRMWAGDFSPADQERMRQLHAAQPCDWLRIVSSGVDGRLMELGERLIGRESPDLLPPTRLAAWTAHVQGRAGGDLKTPDWLAILRKRAQDSALTFPTAVGLVQLNERLARLFG